MGVLTGLGVLIAILGIVLLIQPGRRALGGPLVIIGLVSAVLSQSFVVIPAGNVGVVFNVLRGVQPQPLGEGTHIVLPFIQEVIIYDARLQEVTLAVPAPGAREPAPSEEAITARSKEGLEIGVDVTVQYRVKRDEAPLSGFYHNPRISLSRTLGSAENFLTERNTGHLLRCRRFRITSRRYISPAAPLRLREASSPNTVSRLWCKRFSTSQCPRHRAYSRLAGACRLVRA
ncbi:MAG: SPFH domain-containing protein [Deinococcus sp.]|nr:SPFH domain-containing protein [Deinococcus sp.]